MEGDSKNVLSIVFDKTKIIFAIYLVLLFVLLAFDNSVNKSFNEATEQQQKITLIEFGIIYSVLTYLLLLIIPLIIAMLIFRSSMNNKFGYSILHFSCVLFLAIWFFIVYGLVSKFDITPIYRMLFPILIIVFWVHNVFTYRRMLKSYSEPLNGETSTNTINKSPKERSLRMKKILKIIFLVTLIIYSFAILFDIGISYYVFKTQPDLFLEVEVTDELVKYLEHGGNFFISKKVFLSLLLIAVYPFLYLITIKNKIKASEIGFIIFSIIIFISSIFRFGVAYRWTKVLGS